MTKMTPMTTEARTLLARTLWRIEAHLNDPPTLTGLASTEGVSPFHLTRAFALTLGVAPMAYVRARRLTEAARALRSTDLKIVEIAFDAGYDSHEGFTRAFRDRFGCSPSHIRSHPETPIALQEAISMPATTPLQVTARFETLKEIRLRGRARRHTMETRHRIPQQWQEVAQEMGEAMAEVPCYGACYGFEGDAFTYLVGINSDVPNDAPDLDELTLPAGEYAVFEHEGHISTISQTWAAIFETWMPSSGVAPGEGPEFELYSTEFDMTKSGGVSIWIPVTRP